jgi:alpha-tubulin suppressor-like RCC1 family protein
VSVIAAATSVVVLALCSPLTLRAQPRLTEAQAAALRATPPSLIPKVGEFYRLSNPGAPEPTDPFPGLPVFLLPDGRSWLVDDSSLPPPPPPDRVAAARSFLTQASLASQQRLATPMLSDDGVPGLPDPTNSPPPVDPIPPVLLSPGTAPTNGTFWFLVESNAPPLFFNPCTYCDVYALSDGSFLVDDTGYSWPTPSGDSGGGQGPYQPAYSSGDLYLDITGVTNSRANLILHGTSNGVLYTILSRHSLLPGDPWHAEQPLVGAAGQDWTPTQIPMFGRRMLFFRALVGSATPTRLWLFPLGIRSNCFNVVLHGTVEGTSYDILSTTSLHATNTWTTETVFLGASGQFWTQVSIPLSNRPNLFLSARSCEDNDGDRIPDAWEIMHGLNPMDPSDAGLDPDDDGFTNLQEYQNGGNPFDPMLVVWGDNYSTQSTVPWDFPGVTSMAGGGGSASGGFTLAVTNQGRIVAWGVDNYGQTDVPTGLSNVVAVTAGGDQCAALKADRTVVQWGRPFARIPDSVTNITAISAGYQHFLALRADGTVATWGGSNCPAKFVPSGLGGVKAIGAGWNHNVALLSNGTLAAWGLSGASLNWNLTNVPTNLTGVAAISVGALHSVALRSNGTVVAWGYNLGGETNVPAGLSNVVAIAAGRGYTLALRQDQSLVGWGAGLPAIPSGLAASSIAAGPGHALALRVGVLTPLILEQPRSQGAPAGGPATFRVRVSSRQRPGYQWQKNGTNILGKTDATLVISNVQDADQGHYRVHVTNGAGAVYSGAAELILVLPPVINSPILPQTILAEPDRSLTLTVSATAQGSQYSGLQYLWYKDGQRMPDALPEPDLTLGSLIPLESGQYWAVVTNVAGSATSAVWTVKVVAPGAVGGWGTNAMLPPQQLTNAIALAGGGGHALGLSEQGIVFGWGNNDFGQTNVPAGLSNVIAVAAGAAHSIALKDDGSVIAWGRNDLHQTNVPSTVTDAIAISAGGQQSLALQKDGTVVEWGQTNAVVPSGLASVTAIASGTNFHLALLSNSTVVAWGANGSGQSTVPTNLTNVVAIAAGGAHALALKSDGTVTGWGSDGSGESDAPPDLTNALAIAAGAAHSVALRNDGTIVAWGNNAAGQANSNVVWRAVKLIAAGDDFTLASQFSSLLQYPVDVTKDLLLIYNSSSVDSSNVCAYYLQHRPMVTGANVLGFECLTNEIIDTITFTNQILAPVQGWLAANPTKHPQYMILFPAIPTRVWGNVTNVDTVSNSVAFGLYTNFSGIQPFVTSINMGLSDLTTDCYAYINKLERFGTNCSPGKPFISAHADGYANTNYLVDDVSNRGIAGFSGITNALLAVGVPAASITYLAGAEPCIQITTNIVDNVTNYPCVTWLAHPHITNSLSVAGYLCWGAHSTLGNEYPRNKTLNWNQSSSWWIIETIESFNGQRDLGMGNFTQWFSDRAFGGTIYTNYECTPVGAVSNTDEPYAGIDDAAEYFVLWAQGKNFAICAWNCRKTEKFQAVGDPFVTK